MAHAELVARDPNLPDLYAPGSDDEPRESGSTHSVGVAQPRNRATVPLASQPRILDAFTRELKNRGFAGPTERPRLLYLTITSRVFRKPGSVIVKGPSSAGKSHDIEAVLAFFPPEAYYVLTSVSPKALIHGETSLVHRTLVIVEAAGIGDDGDQVTGPRSSVHPL